MKSISRRMVLVAAATAMLATPAAAQVREGSVELGLGAGYQWFGEQENLEHAPYFVFRGGYNFNTIFGAELSVGWTPTELYEAVQGEKSSVDVWDTDADFIVHLLEGRFVPFAKVGAGLRIHQNDSFPSDQQTDIDWTVHYGVGAKVWLSQHVGLRLDVAHQFLRDAAPYELKGVAEIDGIDNYFNHLIVAGALTFQLGGDAPDKDGDGIDNDVDQCPDDPEDKDGFEDSNGCPDPDNDADGILDVNDQCPGEAEDKDGFQDEDGCPDPDNDGDGIADADDKCPGEAESQNGVDDEDGCPEADSDNDGLVDPRDQCPQQAEDKDGFEDEDGCPDDDNDKDGVADAADKCPMQPESVNGYLDDDGCPDEIPVKLKQFTGTIEGIQFETGSDRIKKQSLGKLRKAVTVLQEFGDLKVVIEGHTDNVGKDELNQDLSQRRAESVRKYMIDQGIDAGRLTAQGFGPSKPVADNDTKDGRAKNRRVEFRLTK